MENTAPPDITDDATLQNLKALIETFRNQHEEFTALTKEAHELREENARLKRMLARRRRPVPESKPAEPVEAPAGGAVVFADGSDPLIVIPMP